MAFSTRAGHREFEERDREVRANRLNSEELQQLQEEVARKKEEERKAREMKTRRRGEEIQTKIDVEEVRMMSCLCHLV